MPETPENRDREIAAPVIDWYRSAARDLPWRRPEFHERFGAWGVLVSEFMLQQTPVARVIPRLDAWLERWPSPADMATASPAEVVQQWANLGYPRRALWLHRAATEVVREHDGTVPRDVPALLALTGIGDYTARAVAVFSYGDRHPVVDTNTRRVLARAVDGIAHPGPPSRRDLALMEAQMPVDDSAAAVFNAAVMELGATVCTARAPICEECPIADRCAWIAAGSPATVDTRRKQAAYEGSDRQARGAVLRVLREIAPAGIALEDLLPDWPDPLQRDRAIDSLVADGLAEAGNGEIALPR
ncbi:A/G-specific adenine glycosylase [Microbacterium sp. kSW2-24]|uniref:A/G-specific adenine glycosylase n=1 Tax=Microbacterium galbinum TaxID=2851646 RepID=UPI001FFCA887|nr:A/G-specific adenine glycosylase [Microbacterium galbinum]MCK2022052.1 A/G-specific adenine glycosylase [Microbacterium galbinum]